MLASLSSKGLLLEAASIREGRCQTRIDPFNPAIWSSDPKRLVGDTLSLSPSTTAPSATALNL